MDTPFPVRPKPVRRQATVAAVRSVTPLMRRITLQGADVATFLDDAQTRAPAAWVKLFVPAADGGEAGRAYTIRRIDPIRKTIDIDFVLHEHGPAGRWAGDAVPGRSIAFAGPRGGGFVLIPSTRWLLLAGDETALPAIHSLLERLPGHVHAHAAIEIDDSREQQALSTAADLKVEWMPRAGRSCGRRWRDAAAALVGDAPLDVGQVWAAGEASAVRDLRDYWLAERGIERSRVSTKGYWKRGETDYKGQAD